MHPVSTHGAHKITMNSAERDYQQRKAQAMAQADGNSNVIGIQAQNNFQQMANPANVPTPAPQNTTGSLALGTQAGTFVNESPAQFQSEALEMQSDKLSQKIDLITNALSNAGDSHNDRSRIGSLNNG